jgi:hypothetical protein
LQRQHPDVVSVVQRFGRPHHHVNYGAFRTNALQRDRSVRIKDIKHGMEDAPRPA